MTRAPRSLLRHPVRALASLRLTVWLLSVALLALLAGTVAQATSGLEAARARFFDAAIVFFGPLPLPGIRLAAAAAAIQLLFALARLRRPLRHHAGILVAHAGLVCIVASGFAAGITYRHSFVMLREGATASTSFDPSSWDLRLEPGGAAVPLERLLAGQAVPGAPSMIVERRFDNSRPLVGPTGDALSSLAPLRREADPAANRPGVILSVSSPLGPVRSVVWAGRSTPVGGAGEGVHAQLARHEQPLAAALTLTRLEVARYPGTDTLKSLAAHVRVDARGSARDAVVGPNRPLRLGSDTVYVSAQVSDEAGVPVLVLGVSRNPARIPLYFSAVLIVVGLALHVGLRPPIVPALLLLCLLSPGSAQARDRPPLGELARIPVLSGGRVMPLEAYARLTLRELSGSTRLDGEPAIGWMARVLFAPQSTFADRLFVVRHRETLARAGLTAAGGRLSFEELEPASRRLGDLAARYSSRNASGPVEAEIVGLVGRLALFTRLVASSDYARPHADFAVREGEGAVRLGLAPGLHSLREIAEARDRLDGRWESEPAALRLRDALSRWAADYRGVVPAIIPEGPDSWTSPVAALAGGGEPAAAAAFFGLAADAFDRGDWRAMQDALEELERASAARAGDPAARRVRLEVFVDGVHPFAVAMILQGLALALTLVGARRPAADRAAAAALLLGGACMAAGLLLDALIAARPPVSTLSATFAFVALVLAMAGLAARGAGAPPAAVAAGAAAGLLLTAAGRGIAAAGGALAVLPAQLDASFLLTAHVATICLGYAAALAAAVLGHLWLARRIVRPEDAAGLGRLQAALRAALRLALPLCVAGTLLGGAWADRAWGRFWNWDPKENAALFLVLSIAAVLHAVRARLLRAEGAAAAASALVFPVGFSWLAVNLMGTGLHSYGSAAGSGPALAVAYAAEALFLAAALLLPRLPRKPSGSGDQVWRHRVE